jgi:hypothetical protein
MSSGGCPLDISCNPPTWHTNVITELSTRVMLINEDDGTFLGIVHNHG